MSHAMKDEGKVSSSAAASASPASSSSMVGSHDAFRMVDDLVAKPTYGSDGAASWQTFRNEAASKDGRVMKKGSSSLGSAPLAPLKKLDRALQFRSWDDEVKYERALRQQEGQADMNSGYQLFHEKKKKKKKQTEKEEEDGQPAASAESEARNGGGTGSRKRGGGSEADHNESIKKKTKKKLKEAPVVPVVVDTPDHPLQQLAEVMQKRHQQQQQQQQRASSTLPAGWESAHDAASQKTYYFNRTLGRRQWSVPGVVATSENNSVPPSGSGAAGDGTGRSPGRTDEADDDMLPPGWVAVTDPSTRKTYYYHAETRETRWDKPTILAAHADPDADEP